MKHNLILPDIVVEKATIKTGTYQYDTKHAFQRWSAVQTIPSISVNAILFRPYSHLLVKIKGTKISKFICVCVYVYATSLVLCFFFPENLYRRYCC